MDLGGSNSNEKVTNFYSRTTEPQLIVFASAFHQTGLDTRSMTRRPIKVGIKGMAKSGTNRDSNPAGLCRSLTHEVQCESNEPSRFMNPNLGPGTDAWTRQQGLVLYMGDKGVNNADCLPEGNLAETRSVTASSLLLFLFRASLQPKRPSGL